MNNKSSIDFDELKKFDQWSQEWWNEDGVFKTLHNINPVRLKFIIDKINNHFINLNLKHALTNLEILDVGCGGGLIALPLARLGANITAIDISAANIKTASQYATANNLKIKYQNVTVEQLALTSQQYDVILCLEVIEHIVKLDEFIKNLNTLTKPGGMLIFSTINRNFKSYLLVIILAEYILHWLPKETHKHSKFLKPAELNALLNKHDLIIKELKGLTFNPFLQIWNLNNNIDVNYFAYVSKNF